MKKFTVFTSIFLFIFLFGAGVGFAKKGFGAQCPGSPWPPDPKEWLSVWNTDIVNVTDSNPDPKKRCNGTGDIRCVSETGTGVNIVVLDSGLIKDWQCHLPEGQIDTKHARSFVDPLLHEGSSVGWKNSGNQHGTDVT